MLFIKISVLMEILLMENQELDVPPVKLSLMWIKNIYFLNPRSFKKQTFLFKTGYAFYLGKLLELFGSY